MSEAFMGGLSKKKFASGSFTPSAVITSPYTISGLGFTPTGCLMFRTDSIGSAYTDIIQESYDAKTQKGIYISIGTSGISSVTPITSSNSINRPSFGDGTITFYVADNYGNRLNTYTFYWFAWADE